MYGTISLLKVVLALSEVDELLEVVDEVSILGNRRSTHESAHSSKSESLC